LYKKIPQKYLNKKVKEEEVFPLLLLSVKGFGSSAQNGFKKRKTAVKMCHGFKFSIHFLLSTCSKIFS
jgi:hypothetical protein